MPSAAKDKISSKQLVFVILGNTVATGMLTLPRGVVSKAGQDAWIALILGSIIPILVLLLVNKFYRYFPGYSFADISCLLFGKVVGTILIGGILLYFMSYQFVVLGALTEITTTFILPNTPHRAIMLVSALAMIYVASQGVQVVARIDELFFYQFLAVIILWIVPAISGDYTNLFPVGGSGWEGISKGFFTTTFAFSGMEILLLLYPAVTRPREVVRAGLTAAGITLVLYLVITLSCLLVFGTDALKSLSIWPGFTLLKVLDIPVVGRLDIFLLLLWLGFAMRPAFTCHMAGAYVLTGLWGKRSKHTYLYFTLGLGAILIGSAFIPVTIQQIYAFTDLVGKSMWVVAFVIPLLYLGMGTLRGKLISPAKRG